jgi:phosphoribosylaminoimidazole-succinocarboxamide synthase
MDKEFLYEGKAKKIYSVKGKNHIFIQEFKDDATAFDGIKKDKLKDKGVLNNTISSIIFEYLNKHGIPSHYIEKISDNEMLVKGVKIILVEVVCRNIAAGSLVKRYGIKEGLVLKKPIVEFYYKSDELHDPLFTEEHIFAMELADEMELKLMKEFALKINDLLIKFFSENGLKLVDFKLEFGRDKDGNIILADEISPDTCRLWDSKTNKKLDKDRFRFDLGEVMESYKEIKDRIS